MGGNGGYKGRLEAATISDILYLLIREILFLLGTSQGILKGDVWQPWQCSSF